uniref:PGG domain-containing protein n=1 Tax=Oryza glumipatula TaxID=40148 RepID=A0A0E0AGU6_9ORYZ
MDSRRHKAAVQGSSASLAALLWEEGGAKILNSTTPQGNTALHIAAGFGHVAFVEAAVGEHGDLLIAKNNEGDTPLHLAIRAGSMAVVDKLFTFSTLAGPCWPEEEPLIMMNNAHNTPLHEAVKHRRSAVALRLLDEQPLCGRTRNMDMLTPLHIAAREGLTDVVDKIVDIPWVPEKFIATNNVNGTALHQAVLGGHTRVVEILLVKTAPGLIDLTDAVGNTALHFAAQKNDKRMVRMLLDHRPDLAHRRNDRQQSALHVAAYYGSTAAAAELLRHSPDSAEMLDKDGRNVVHVAVSKVDTLRSLLKLMSLQADVINQGDSAGDTPLHLAAKMAHVQSTLTLLKDPRVNPCLLNRDGHTARSLVEERLTGGEMDAYVVYLWEKLNKYESRRCKNLQQLPPVAVATYQVQSLRRRGHRSGSGNDEYLGPTRSWPPSSPPSPSPPPSPCPATSGLAIHADRAAFSIFLVSNTIAMCSSIAVVFCFIWAWRVPAKFNLEHLIWVHILTVIACLAMIVSLMTSAYLTVLPTKRWPAYLVITIGACTPVVVILILGKEAFYIPFVQKPLLPVDVKSHNSNGDIQI